MSYELIEISGPNRGRFKRQYAMGGGTVTLEEGMCIKEQNGAKIRKIKLNETMYWEKKIRENRLEKK
jgi:hypothetical protein